MAEELLINVNPFETRVALVSHGLLQELHVVRPSKHSVAGNIYLGQVVRIVPGMQAAFVDIGLARAGFLHAKDISVAQISLSEAAAKTADNPDIRDLLHDGQMIVVQVEKDPISTKGARLSSQLTLASKYLVLMPGGGHVGVSQRIEDDAERERLRELLHDVRARHHLSGGLIARTSAEGVDVDQLDVEIRDLLRLWAGISERREKVVKPGLIHEELPVQMRIIRDLASMDTATVLIDDERTFAQVCAYVDEFAPQYIQQIKFYSGVRPLFERHGVEGEIKRALQPEVPLKCGGTLVIEPTEAMISIDVNTGSFLGGRNPQETAFRTNLEAAASIPRQLRLRNLGGIVVIDFIDMKDEMHQRQDMRVLEKAAEVDPARTRIEGISTLGLVHMSRKRTRESLLQSMSSPCAHCLGTGMSSSAQSTAAEILRSLVLDYQARCRRQDVSGDYLVRATQAVVDRLLDADASHVAAFSAAAKRKILFQVEPSYAEGQYDFVLKPSLTH